MVLFYVIIVQMLHFLPTSVILGFPPSHLFFYFLVLTTAIIVFLAPITAVHRTMQEAKRRASEFEMNEFYRLNSQGLSLHAKDADDIFAKDFSHKLKENRRRYEWVSSMPVWPYDVRTLVRFTTGIAASVSLFALKTVLTDSGFLPWLYKLLLGKSS